MPLTQYLTLMPLADWLALVWFVAVWVGYAIFARRRAERSGSLLATTNHYRRLWMLQTTARENRVVDGVVVQNLSTSPSFFASTTILIIGGLLALLGTSDKASEFVREIPFAARTSAFVFDLKMIVLLVIFIYAFFRFTWSMRQYTFGALLIASMPDAGTFERGEAQREPFADRAGKVVGLAAETFNDGLRAYYMSFATILWFVSPIAFAAAAAAVVYLLYQREFHSEILGVLRD
ncbi:MAG: DUF599 domain-containing protein [Burkholderiaceae bacterium]